MKVLFRMLILVCLYALIFITNKIGDRICSIEASVGIAHPNEPPYCLDAKATK